MNSYAMGCQNKQKLMYKILALSIITPIIFLWTYEALDVTVADGYMHKCVCQRS